MHMKHLNDPPPTTLPLHRLGIRQSSLWIHSHGGSWVPVEEYDAVYGSNAEEQYEPEPMVDEL